MNATKLTPGDVILSKYRVDQILGQGAMGIVYAVTHVDLGTRFALKILANRATDEARARFTREARASARLKTQHVAKVVDVGTIDDTPYMLMEHLEGRDLAAELKARGPLPFTTAVDLMLQACEAVAEAHAAGIVHRDLKPANLFLTTAADGSPCVKVLDFGVSKAKAEVDMTGDHVLGSPLYMSPEQMKASAAVDARSDVWALAVTLYQLVAGSTPFHAKGLEAVMTRVFLEPPDPLPTYRSDVPPGFEGVIRMALEKDRERRIPSVAALAAALAPYGTAEATMYAERAARVLGEQVAVSRPTAEIHAPTEAALMAAAANPPAPAATDGAMLHATAATAPRRGPGRWIVIAAGGLVVAGIAVAAVLGGKGRTLRAGGVASTMPSALVTPASVSSSTAAAIASASAVPSGAASTLPIVTASAAPSATTAASNRAIPKAPVHLPAKSPTSQGKAPGDLFAQ
jgi:serine/threonine-protein kinase